MDKKYVERNLKKTFKETAKNHKVTAVVGPRQSGKTTFLKKRLMNKNASYVLFDDPDAKELFEENIKGFEQQYIEGYDVTGLDEIQYCERAGENLKYLADTDNTLWITSSSETILKKDVLSYLVGRVSINKLYPFNFGEFLRAKEIKALTEKRKTRLIKQHCMFGGYPNIVLTRSKQAKLDILSNLYETMLLKDVAQTFSISSIDTLKKLVKYLSFQTAQMIKYEKISDKLDVGFKTVKNYLTALEQSYILERVKPFYKNKQKEIVKRPKIFFLDNGLLNYTRNDFESGVDGSVFENYVFTELIKQNNEIKYWRTKSKVEVDFIVREETPIEVKKTSRNKIPSGLKSFIRRYNPDKAYVVHYEGENKSKTFRDTEVIFTDIHSLVSRL